MTCSCGRITEAPALILWNCVCGSTRAQRWGEATRAQRRDAFLVELAKESKNEMAMWGG